VDEHALTTQPPLPTRASRARGNCCRLVGPVSLADQALTPGPSPDSCLTGEGRRSFRFVALLGAILLGLMWVSVGSADGEAGLVVQDGDQVRTYCIAFEGDGITGAEMLTRAGLTFDAYGGGSGLALCSIGARGCADSSSFASCFCECQGGDCTYWAFFTRQYGKGWVYSSLAFNLLRAKDGDVHGWKWGKGGPNSAPAPQDVTFEQICGHAPRGGAQPTAPPATAAPATQLPPTATLGATTAPTAAASADVSPGASTSVPATASLPTVTITIAGETSSPGTSPSPTSSAAFEQRPDEGDDEGSSTAGLVAFGAIALVLVGAIGGAVAWRTRNGA
jgi:hypothetical protein